jgi:type III restriction enzyme
LTKLQGLARYAERHGAVFRRIDAVAVLDGEYRVLDMTKTGVGHAVLAAASAKSLYTSVVAQEYVTKA